MERDDNGSDEQWRGNYDDLAALVRVKAQAKMVLVLVIDGIRGSGVSVRVEGREVTQEQADLLLGQMFVQAGARAEKRARERLAKEPS